MPIVVTCSCGKKFTTKDENAGKKSRCAACGATIVIPGAVAKVATTASTSDASSMPRRAATTPREDTFDLVGTDEYIPPKPSTQPVIAAPSNQSAKAPSRVPPAAMMFPGSAPRPNTKDRERQIHIGGGLMTFTIAALIIVGIVIFLFKKGPVKAQEKWKEMEPQYESDVLTTVSFAMRGYYASKGADTGTFKDMPRATSAWFDEPLLMWRVPSSMAVQGVVTGGKFHGTYHTDTGEVEVSINLDLEGTVLTDVTGRVKDGAASAEIKGTPLKDLPPAKWSGSRYK